MRMRTASAILLLAPLVGGCGGIQSAIDPAGPEAARIAVLWWVLFGGAVAIMVWVMAFTALALFGRDGWRQRLAAERTVVACGIVVPMVALTALLTWGLLLMRGDASFAEPRNAQPRAPRITVVGEQWWWRVVYETADGRRVESANEVRIPTGEAMTIALQTADVIHSFWVPSLAGKLDMIPGRTNVISLSADRAGISRGQCAEYCGGAHALMAFNVVAMAPEDFARWLATEAGPAEAPEGEAEAAGRGLFMANGCGACHAIRGTEAAGTIGPDLTHLGGRTSLAAGIMSNNADAIARWIADNQHIKPENRMPGYPIFSEDQLAAMAQYLAGLE